MESTVRHKLELMADNFEVLRQAFKWDNDLSKHLVALNYAMHNRRVEPEAIKGLKEFLKEETKLFSPFRGSMMFAICGILAGSSEAPRRQLENMIDNLKAMKAAGFKQTTYLPTALYALTSVADSDMSHIIGQAWNVYSEMRKNHPFLTSGDDYALAVLLASQNKSPTLMEAYYSSLNQMGFSKGNGLQMLSHILSFSPLEVGLTVERCHKVFKVMKAEKLKVYNTGYPTLGLLSLVWDEALEKDYLAVVKDLQKRKRYKWLGKNMNIILAAGLVVSDYLDASTSTVLNTSLQISVQAIIAAQQAAMVAATAGAGAAAASS